MDLSFHSRQTQRVIGELFLSLADDISGVPQGFVLGPILFLIFINDVVLTSCGNTNVRPLLFADDLKLYSIYDMSNTKGPFKHYYQ